MYHQHRDEEESRKRTSPTLTHSFLHFQPQRTTVSKTSPPRKTDISRTLHSAEGIIQYNNNNNINKLI